MSKKTIEEVFELSNGIAELQKAENTNYFFNSFLAKLNKSIKNIVKEAQEDLSFLQKEHEALLVKYAEKDDEGKPISRQIGNRRVYKGLEKGFNPEYDSQSEKIQEDQKAKLKEEVDIDFDNISIKKENVPQKNLPGWAQETIQDFIIEE